VDKPELQIVVDTREQRPYFQGAKRKALKSGDYSLIGCEDSIAIERKSLSDALGCIGTECRRFEAELARLRDMQFAALIIECGLRDLLTAPSLIHWNARLGTLVSWCVKFKVPIWFANNRALDELVTHRLLEKALKYSSEQTPTEPQP